MKNIIENKHRNVNEHKHRILMRLNNISKNKREDENKQKENY